ncbi:MAG: HD domain-containing protein [Planctomycetaceae bacterium]|nr:HD domain-containing protein [Planctomycetaceae bacterium]
MQEITDRFSDAVKLAVQLHRHQRRKGSDIPYISHPLRVAGLVLEFGADEDTAIAAILHDAVEDQGGMPTARLIHEQFGERVERFVLGCSDSFCETGQPKRPWRERKEEKIASIGNADPEIRLIIACDKLDNLRSTLLGYPKRGEEFWKNFSGGRDGTLWYYRSVINALRGAGGSPVLTELESALTRLETMIQEIEPEREA